VGTLTASRVAHDLQVGIDFYGYLRLNGVAGLPHPLECPLERSGQRVVFRLFPQEAKNLAVVTTVRQINKRSLTGSERSWRKGVDAWLKKSVRGNG
jgi:hypothetical protein